MNVGRLAWRTPTGAMLWEIWGQHKVKFLWQGLALAASAFLVHSKEHGASQSIGDGLVPLSWMCFLGAYLHLLVCFGYVEIDSRSVRFGFPGRLLLKPASTARLVLVPMLFGGAITVIVFALWSELVLRHLVNYTASDQLWITVVLLSLFWWMQALSWSLPLLKGRTLAVVSAAVVHFLVWLLPRLPTSALSNWHWPILAALLVFAPPVAWIGLKLMRQGRWEGPSRIFMLWSRVPFAQARGRLKKFRSAFRAQFWLEWRRQGLVLPGIAGGMAFLIFPLVLKCFQLVGENAPLEAIAGVLTLPLLASSLLAAVLARFDSLHSTSVLPVYIAVRPMTNGGFVMAKLAMALATSALAWLVTVASVCFWLMLMEKGYSFSMAGLDTPFGQVPLITGFVPVLFLLVLLTWKNLVAGIGAGLTGRSWTVAAFSIWNFYFVYIGLFALVTTAWTNLSFRASLLHWLPGILIVCLVAKVAVSIAAFVWGTRRNAITAQAIVWIMGGWLVCGLLIAGYASHVCHAINKPGLWIWIALGGFLILPLADLAIAPLALAWNRHR